MIRLLISVRSVGEASVALHSGAELIDIKEPSRGSMGMSSPETLSAVAREVPPRFPVSAAVGEWTDWVGQGRFPPLLDGLAYLKMGLAGVGRMDQWREELGRFYREVCESGETFSQPAWVAVAYADWQRAHAPRPEEVLDFAAARGWPVFLLDTWGKDGTSLFDWIDPAGVQRLAEAARLHGMEVALAGSLRLCDLDRVAPIAPDVVAFRSAICKGQDRTGPIDGSAVQALADRVTELRETLLVGAHSGSV